MALKIIDKSKVGVVAMQKLAREVKVLKLLNHPHIIRLYEVIDTPKELILVMEYASGGELHDYLATVGRLKESEARRYFRQMTTAMEHCHRLRIIHRDLKTENLLFDVNMNLKICDFGFGNLYDPRQRLNTHCGSPPFASPELYLVIMIRVRRDTRSFIFVGQGIRRAGIGHVGLGHHLVRPVDGQSSLRQRYFPRYP